MALGIPLVWTDAHQLHNPDGEIWIGVPIPADDLPARAAAIRAALERAGASVVTALPHSADALVAVHEPKLVSFLEGAWSAWEAAGLPDDPGQKDVVGYIFPHPGLLAGLEAREPAALAARTGAYCYDTMTVIGPGTREAARAAADTALTAADLVLEGAPAAYACCRPPGHHVTRSAFGGSCYLNNSAVAAQFLRDRGVHGSPSSMSMPTTGTARRPSSGSVTTSSRPPSMSTRVTAVSRTTWDSQTSEAAATGEGFN